MRQLFTTILLAAVGATALGLVSAVAASNPHFLNDPRPHAVIGIHRSLALLTNAGSIWASLAFLVGRMSPGKILPAVLGPLALLIALAVHYEVALIFDLMPWTNASQNAGWFLLAVLFGAPLGLFGALSRGTGWTGLLCRALIPLGFIGEALLMTTNATAGAIGGPHFYAELIAGLILLFTGCFGLVTLTRRHYRHPDAGRRPHVPQ